VRSKKKDKKNRFHADHPLAQDLLKTLLQGYLERPKVAKREEWQCRCSTSNWVERQACRSCGEAPRLVRGKGKGTSKNQPQGGARPRASPSSSAQASQPAHPKVNKTPPKAGAPEGQAAPKVDAAAAALEVKALASALEAAEAAGGSARLLAHLRAELESAEKKASVPPRPLLERLQGTRSYLERARRRLAAAEEALVEAQTTRDTVALDIQEHEVKLAELEREARPPPEVTPSEPNMVQALEAVLGALELTLAEPKRRRIEPSAAMTDTMESDRQMPEGEVPPMGALTEQLRQVLAAMRSGSSISPQGSNNINKEGGSGSEEMQRARVAAQGWARPLK
jgi:hypothetical protein